MGKVVREDQEAMFMFERRSIPAISLAILLAAFAAGCGPKKHTPIPPPPPPTPEAQQPAPQVAEVAKPAAPAVAQFTAEPTSILIGQSSTLRWQVTGEVTGVTIDQTIGTVQNTGSRRVFPSQPTTYTLTATGPGGATTAQATVNVVNAPGPPPPPGPALGPSSGGSGGGTLPDRLTSGVQDIYFDYDQSEVRSDGQNILAQDAAALKAALADFPNAIIMIEGHCDERGSAEYNLGLGDRRASSVKDYLQQLGVPADRIRTISYGKERPQCTESDEACWQKNRRVHFSPGQ
jgi:peptidoglycan-associated lipoprotein